MDPTRIKVSTLKEICSRWGVQTSDTKSDLIRRLQEADPTNKWLEEASGLQNKEHVEEMNERERTEINWPPPIGQLENNSPLSSEQRQDKNRELDFLIRERDLMRREIELARRKVEILRNSPASLLAQQELRHVNVNTIKDLIGDFDGSDANFKNWKERFQLLCATYELENWKLAHGKFLNPSTNTSMKR